MDRKLERWALISVSDKSGLRELAEELVDLEIGILTTGGSSKILKESNIPFTEVSKYTGHPEIMGGRVKTLHPKIHGGILGRDGIDYDLMEELGIYSIDFVVVNLYPFEETASKEGVSFDEVIENIDIGGPALLRAAAKNHSRVTSVCSPDDYQDIVSQLKTSGNIPLDKRRVLAAKSFRHVSLYDEKIAGYLGSFDRSDDLQFPSEKKINLKRKKILRYGENPHQGAALYEIDLTDAKGVANSRQLAGKQLSYNNLVDADTAIECVRSFNGASCVIVKHANPCGVSESETLKGAYEKAFSADPTSAFGGVIGFNRPVTKTLAQLILSNQFLEVIVAPDYDEESLEIFAKKENVRVLKVSGNHGRVHSDWELKTIGGGLLVQEKDRPEKEGVMQSASEIVTTRSPTEEERTDLFFAYRVASFVKSNAIVFVKDRLSIGIGAGQMSRIYSAKLAGIKALDAGFKVGGAVMASDAFFPFRDGIDEAAAQGIRAVIQPGGSVRDKEVIEAANEHSIAMIFTGRRHFRH